MADCKTLPIYKTTYELLILITRKTKEFPREFRFTLGEKLRDECIELVIFIYKANSSRQKRAEHLQQILERLQVIELISRLSKDMHLLNVTGFSEIVALTDSLARQAQGWMNHSIGSGAE